MGIKNFSINPKFIFNPKIDVVKYDIFSPKLYEDTEEVVVLIGDLHGYHNNKGKREKLIIEIEEQNPHHIIIAGDIMQGKKWENDNSLSDLQDFLLALSKVAPVFLTLGNHDIFGWNEKNTKQRKDNYEALRKPGSIYPLFNTGEELGPFYIYGLVPSHYLMSSLSIQTTGRAHDLFIEECKRNGIQLEDKSDVINELICHNPHIICQAGKVLNNGEISYDISCAAHTHGGSVPTILRKKYPDLFRDNGIVERPFTINSEGKLSRINPLVYAKTNLCSGIVYTDTEVQQRILQLSNENFYLNISSEINTRNWLRANGEDLETVKRLLRTADLSANIITTGIRKLGNDIITHKPEVTVIKVTGTKKQAKTQTKKRVA